MQVKDLFCYFFLSTRFKIAQDIEAMHRDQEIKKKPRREIATASCVS